MRHKYFNFINVILAFMASGVSCLIVLYFYLVTFNPSFGLEYDVPAPQQTVVALMFHPTPFPPESVSEAKFTKNSSMDDILNASLQNSYTTDELTAAMKDYYNISTAPLSSPDSRYADKFRKYFQDENLQQLDATAHALLFDSQLSRQQKLSTLLSLIPETSGIRREYILDTLGALNPVEATDTLLDLYNTGCSDEACRLKVFEALLDGISIRRFKEKFSPDQLNQIKEATRKVKELADTEILNPHSANLQEQAADALLRLSPHSADDLRDLSGSDTGIGAFTQAVLGSPNPSPEDITLLLSRISALKGDTRQRVLGTVKSFLDNVPVSPAVREKFTPLLTEEKSG